MSEDNVVIKVVAARAPAFQHAAPFLEAIREELVPEPVRVFVRRRKPGSESCRIEATSANPAPCLGEVETI